MKATTGSNVITVDIPSMITRRGGTLLMAIGALLGIIFWLDKLFLHLAILGFAGTLGIWVGVIGLALFVIYWLLKPFGYTK